MGFCYYSKENSLNGYTSIENKFIVKYLPQAEDVAVKVYLYGLYLCQSPMRDFSLTDCEEVLKIDREKIISAFEFWEDMDLVRVICREPFTVEYLPVTSLDGKPKKIRYEKYAEFNKELQRRMQTVGIFLDYPMMQKFMNFMQGCEMDQQAFMLIVEYCIQSYGASVTTTQILNKANNFVKRGYTTYNQVEKALSDYNVHTADLKKILALFGSYSKDKEPSPSDYAYLEKWSKRFPLSSVMVVAKSMKKGSMASLDVLLDELAGKDKTEKNDVEEYLAERDLLMNLTFKVARSLGVKISSPVAYADEYVSKWYDRGYEENTLCSIASYAVKTERNTFSGLDDLLETLYMDGVVSTESVDDYLKEKSKDLKLLAKIQSACGNVRKSEANLSMIGVWRSWSFKDEMILEAAKRSGDTARPLPYMNKILSDWKRENVFDVKDIPERTASAPFVNPAVARADERATREKWYADRKAKAESVADGNERKALTDPAFKRATTELSKLEREVAKAEAFNLPTLNELTAKKEEAKKQKHEILLSLGMDEKDLIPHYFCDKCSDSGFMPNGLPCDCYKQ